MVERVGRIACQTMGKDFATRPSGSIRAIGESNNGRVWRSRGWERLLSRSLLLLTAREGLPE